MTAYAPTEKLLRLERDLSLHLSVTSNLQDAMDAILNALEEIDGFDARAIYLIDEGSGELHLAAHCGLPADFVGLITHYPFNSYQAQTIHNGLPVYGQFSEIGGKTEPSLLRHGLKALAIVPIRHGSRILAAINVASRSLMEYTAEQRATIESLAAIFGGALARIRALLRMERNERRFRDLTESTRDLVWETDRDLRIIYSNSVITPLLGYREPEIIGHALFDFILPEDASPLRQLLSELASNRISRGRIECAFRHGSGITLTLESSLVAVRDPCGNLIGYRGLSRDITERIKMEKVLRQKEKEAATILQTAMDGFWIIDTNGKILEVNEAYCRLSGYLREEILSLGIEKLEVIEKPEDTARHIEKVIRNGSDRFETQHRHKNGQLIDLEISVNYLPEQGGRLFAFFRDITARKETDKALRDSEERFKAIALNTPDHILIQDRDLRYKYVLNPQLGMTTEGMIGKTDHDLLPPEEAATLTRIKRGVMETGQSVHLEVPLSSQSGKLEYFDGSYIPKHDATGQIDGLIGYFRNVTERKRLEEESQNARDELERFFDLVPDMVCIASSDGYFKKLNAAWEQTLGFRCEELMSRPLIEFIHPDDREGTLQEIAKQVAGQPTVNFVNRYRCKDGTYRWLEWVSTAAASDMLFAAARDVTGRQQTEEALRESKERFHTLAAGTFEGVALTQKGLFIDANEQLLQILGYARSELIGQPVENFLLPEERERIMENIRLGRESHVEHAMIHKNGEHRIVEAHGQNITYQGGQARITAIRDVTEQRQAQKALQQARDELEQRVHERTAALAASEERFRLATMSSRDAIYDWDLIADRATFCRRHPDLIDAHMASAWQTWQSSLHDEDRDRAVKSLRQALDNGDAERWECEYRVIDPKGRCVYIVDRAMIVRDHQDKALRLIGARADVTERKLAEDKLRENHETLQTIVNGTADIVVMKDREGRYVFVNKAGRETALALSEIIGKTDYDLFPPAYAGHITTNDLEVMQTDQPTTVAESLPLGGELRHFLAVKSPRHDERGQVDGIINILHDVTELRRVEEQIHRSDRLATVCSLAAGVAHEINNPLGMIMISAENALAVRQEDNATQTMERALRNIVADTERCSEMVKNLLHLARQQPSSKTPCDLNQIMQKAVQHTTLQAQDRHIRFQLSLAQDLPNIQANEAECRQLCTLLLGNALANAPNETTISITTQKEKDGVILFIHDQGRKLSEQELKRLFDPYHFPRDGQGESRFGLGIAQKIITEHGGLIDVQSLKGRGTTVTVCFPDLARSPAKEKSYVQSDGCR